MPLASAGPATTPATLDEGHSTHARGPSELPDVPLATRARPTTPATLDEGHSTHARGPPELPDVPLAGRPYRRGREARCTTAGGRLRHTVGDVVTSANRSRSSASRARAGAAHRVTV